MVDNISYTITSINKNNINYTYNNTNLFDFALYTTERPYEEYRQRPETYLVPFIFSIIFIVGVAGNGSLIFLFLRHRTMRNVPNT